MGFTRLGLHLAVTGAALAASVVGAAGGTGASGEITTVAGKGVAGYSGDRGLAATAAIDHPRGIAVMPDGGFLVAEAFGHAVRRIFPDGTIATVAGTGTRGYGGDGGPATSARLNQPHAVAVMRDGSFLIADALNHRIRRVSLTGTITTVAGTGQPGYSGDGGPAAKARLAAPHGIAPLPDGGFLIADTDNYSVRRVAPNGTITTIAGTGKSGYSGDGGPAAAARLSRVFGVAVTPDGGFLIADTANNRIRRVSAEGTITTVAGNGLSGFSGDGGPAARARLTTPHNVTALADGGFLIADTFNQRVRRVLSDGTITTIAGSGTAGYAGDGGDPAAAELDQPKGVAAVGENEFVIADSENNRLRLVATSPTGATTITTVAGNGVAGHAGDRGPATDAAINRPGGIALTADRAILIADTFNDRVRRVSSDGTITTVAGTGAPGYSGDRGPATAARLNLPHGVAAARGGGFLIADTANNRIRRVSADGGITTVAGRGSSGFSGDRGAATRARLAAPRGVASLPDGGFLIADTQNNRIRRVWPNGTITTVAGSGAPGYSGDGGPATAGRLRRPFGVAPLPSGGFLIVDTDNHRIRRVWPDGTITTVAGSGAAGYSGDGGPAIRARLERPCSVARVRGGGFLIADVASQVLRRVLPGGTITTVAGTGRRGYSGDGGPAAAAQLNQPHAVAVTPDGSFVIADTGNNRIRRISRTR